MAAPVPFLNRQIYHFGNSTVAFRSTKIGNVLKENMNDIQ